MTKIAYWLCFVLVAIPTTYSLVALPLSLFGISIPPPPFLFLLFSFGSLVPQMFAPLVPMPVLVILNYTIMFLLLRRVWLFVVKKDRTPLTFQGFQKILGFVGAFSFTLALIAFFLSAVLKASSGVPAGLLLIPSVFCVPWAFFITEVLSFRKVVIQS